MVYIILAEGFEEIEAIEPLDIIRRAGIPAKTAGISSKQITGSHGITVIADILLSEVNRDDMTLLMLPGGPGHELLDANGEVHALLDYAFEHELYVAAICASPAILGRKNFLLNKCATCFPGYEKFLYGAELSTEKAVIDGHIITGKGAGAAADFGFKIVEALKDAETAEKIKGMMQY